MKRAKYEAHPETGRVEDAHPRIVEAREDMTKNPRIEFDRPDPLKVERLNPQLVCFWESKNPNAIARREHKGFRRVRKSDFLDPTKFKAEYEDVVLMVADKEEIERKKAPFIAIREARKRARERETQRIMEEREGLKGYVQGHSFE